MNKPKIVPPVPSRTPLGEAKTTREIGNLRRDHYEEDEMGRDYIDSTSWNDGQNGEARWVPVEAIQKLEAKYESLHSDFITQSEAWQKTIDKVKGLEAEKEKLKELLTETLRQASEYEDKTEKELATAKRKAEAESLEVLRLETKISETQQENKDLQKAGQTLSDLYTKLENRLDAIMLLEKATYTADIRGERISEALKIVIQPYLCPKLLEELRAILQDTIPRNMTQGTINNPDGSSWQPEKEVKST